jgi:uncharacterized protein YjbJ (UPF0337 family)
MIDNRRDGVTPGHQAGAQRPAHWPKELTPMSLGDKVENKLHDAKGKVKEAVGKAIDNEQMEYEGKAEQGKANTKQAGEHVKDAAGNIKDTFNR